MNCLTCKYLNKLKDKKYSCDREIYNGRIYYPSFQVIHKDCPCHSDINKEETRNGFQNAMSFSSSDKCSHCHRTVPSEKYFVNIKDKNDGEKIDRVCTICKDKFFTISEATT